MRRIPASDHYVWPVKCNVTGTTTAGHQAFSAIIVEPAWLTCLQNYIIFMVSWTVMWCLADKVTISDNCFNLFLSVVYSNMMFEYVWTGHADDTFVWVIDELLTPLFCPRSVWSNMSETWSCHLPSLRVATRRVAFAWRLWWRRSPPPSSALASWRTATTASVFPASASGAAPSSLRKSL